MTIAQQKHACDVAGQNVSGKGSRGKLPKHIQPAVDPPQYSKLRLVVSQL